MEFRLLGPLEVVDEDRSLALGGVRQRALLTALLLRANEVVPSDRLLEELWDGDPPPSGVRVVQVYVSQLRKALGDGVIETRAPGYVLVAGDGQIDLRRFERLVGDARGSEPAAAAALLREALALWRGPPLADFAYDGFAQAEIARLEELRLAALEARIDADLALGGHAHVVGELEALVQQHPLRERLREQLMLALYRAGRQSEALEEYQSARRALVEELGIDPGRALRELEAAILRQDPALELFPVPGSEPGRGVFVGRDPELAELAAGLDDALAGRGRLFLLAGEPGIGKSRLAEEVLAHARARGVRVLVGRSWEGGGAPAYWPWVQALRSYVRDAEPGALRTTLGAEAAELAQILPELRDVLPGLPEPLPLEPDSARFRLFDGVTQFLRNAARARPVVLFLDDLHAADTPSLLLLRFLAREVGSARLLVVGAYRDVDPVPGAALVDLLGELTREATTRRIELSGLTSDDVAAYVDLTAAEISSPDVIAALQAETDGNPLFIGEIVRLLATEGVRSGPVAQARLAVPQSVRDVIRRRLAHLSDAANELLLVASVLGYEFDLATLARLAAAPEETILESLDEALQARVVSEAPGLPPRLRFAHVLIRDTLYEGLTLARRIRLHRAATDALEGLEAAALRPRLAELAHHAIAGSELEKGARYARRAADQALELLAFEEAARLYQTALDALDLGRIADQRGRCDLLLSLGEARARAGDDAAAKEAFGAAAATARRLDLPRELARAALGYGGKKVWSRAAGDVRVVPMLEEALAGLGDEETALRARVLARLAGALRDEHSRDRRDALSRTAVDLARQSGDPATLAYALDGRAAAIVAPDTVMECLALGREMCDVARQSGAMDRLVYGYDVCAVAHVILGDLRSAEQDIAAAARIADELRQPAHWWDVYGDLALLALGAGRLSEADELTRRALEAGERSQPDFAVPVYHIQRWLLSDLRGAPQEAGPAIAELADLYPARLVIRCVLVHIHARLGRRADASRELDELARDRFSALPFDQEWLYAMSLLAEAAAVIGATQHAPVLYDLLLPWAELNAADLAEGMLGSVHRYLGLLATALERWEDAERHFEAAVAANERMGVRPWLARSQHDYGAMLIARARPADEARARELLAAADELYRELGMGLS